MAGDWEAEAASTTDKAGGSIHGEGQVGGAFRAQLNLVEVRRMSK